MDTPLEASSTTAGMLLSSSRFAIPQFQRDYAWDDDDIREFWGDLRNGLEEDSYFLGLIILTGPRSKEKDVVDGQQRLLTLTILAAALYHASLAADRRALAERLQATFLRAIDFTSDEELPRISLSNAHDSQTLTAILNRPYAALEVNQEDKSSLSSRLLSAYRIISQLLQDDISRNPFKRLGQWADFLINKLYFASFIHPDPGSAYRVFEIVNTRGKELTTADLLKSFVLSQTAPKERESRYHEWQGMVDSFPGRSSSLFVQFIRHCVTVSLGHILPKDLYDVLARPRSSAEERLSPDELMKLLRTTLPVYIQMVDPTAEGPANEEQLGIFSALNRLNVIAVRPMLLATMETKDASRGMDELLRLVVRRIVVGNLGTGNVERRLGQAAQRIHRDGEWHQAIAGLTDLNPPRETFVRQLQRRSLNKGVLAFVRQSILQETTTPEPIGYLHHIMPRYSQGWAFSQDAASYWISTIGNSLLISDERRPQGSGTWEGVKRRLLPLAVDGEWVTRIRATSEWDEEAVENLGFELAEAAAAIWYSER